jgi:DNA-binding NarL/FixJ family response regulator
MIVAHARLYREGLEMVLSSRPSLQIVGFPEDYATTLTQVSAVHPHVVVIDMATPDALEIVAALRRGASPPKVVAFAIDEQEQQVMTCVEAGAAAYVPRESSIDGLVATIESVVRDEVLCSPRIAATFVRRLAARTGSPEPALENRALTGRERQVFRLIREGLSNKEIGQSLNIAEATVKHHVHHLLEKLEVASRNQAVARATNPIAIIR